jgi:hypothetical protein
MKIMVYLFAAVLLTVSFSCSQQAGKQQKEEKGVTLDTLTDRWTINASNNGIVWNVKDAHIDNLEFSGLRVSASSITERMKIWISF